MNPDVTLVTFRHGPFWNFSYLLGVPGGDALVIDPGWDAPGILAALQEREMRLRAIALTHAHHDHMNALADLVGASDAAVYLHEDEADLLAHEYGGAAKTLPAAEPLPDLPFNVTLLSTPGHTPGSACFLAGERLFTGDTLLTTGPGRRGHAPNASEVLRRSLGFLATLPAATLVLPGHDTGRTPTALLGEALAHGPVR
jgi:hydroxyacylglutathione hydrolase